MFIESLAFIGLFIPGSLIILGIGTVISVTKLNIWIALLMSTIGTASGDAFSYFLGYYFKERILKFWPFYYYPEMVKKSEDFLCQHGGKSILLGRLIGPIRPVMPVMAGIFGVKPMRFIVVNTLAAILWVTIYIIPGIFFGISLSGILKSKVVAIILISIVILSCLTWLYRRAAYLYSIVHDLFR